MESIMSPNCGGSLKLLLKNADTVYLEKLHASILFYF